MSGLPLEPVADVEAAASRAAGRSLAVEGIPMVLALEDATGGRTPGPAGITEAHATALADLLRTYHSVIFPGMDGDAYWPVHDALAVVSDAHAPRPA